VSLIVGSVSGHLCRRSVPLRHCSGSEGPEGFAGYQVTLQVEGVVDRGVDGNEALSLALGLEALHFPLSSSDWKMRILDPVVVG